MSLGSRLLARLSRLPPAHTRALEVERDLRTPMPDGAVLLADRYRPRGDGRAPIVLIRSPYGRRRAAGLVGRVIAERGYQVVVQSVRGTFGSGGTFDAFRHEAADGRATLEWLTAQPWFTGRVMMTGASYLGYVQGAVAAGAPACLTALAPQVTASQFRTPLYPGESFAFDSAISWVHTMHHQEGRFWRVLSATLRQRRQLAGALDHLPLSETDRVAVGRTVRFFQDWLEHSEPGDPFWQDIDHSRRMHTVTAPVHLLGGWYDLFLPEQLADYVALTRAGRTPHLTVGPWTHISPGLLGASLRESLAWFDAHAGEHGSAPRRQPVRIFVMGSKRWLDLPDWPPPARATRWYLHPGAGLATDPPAGSPPDRYTYDPANPTPSVGGIVLGPHAGPRDNRRLESRPDVLVYTSGPLPTDHEVIGPVTAELHVTSSAEHTDFFARLCDVEPGGRSVNICDGLVRVRPGRFARGDDGTTLVRVELWPTAHCFRTGHRLRLQVSSGAHPRYSRNLGGGDPLGAATAPTISHQGVHHDPRHPSALVLPVWDATPPQESETASVNAEVV
jgi:putative CocE/NonD family hydrolase